MRSPTGKELNVAENRKPKTEPDDAEQSRRFVEAARDAEADESGNAFEKAFTSIAPGSPHTKNAPARPKSGKKK